MRQASGKRPATTGANALPMAAPPPSPPTPFNDDVGLQCPDFPFSSLLFNVDVHLRWSKERFFLEVTAPID